VDADSEPSDADHKPQYTGKSPWYKRRLHLNKGTSCAACLARCGAHDWRYITSRALCSYLDLPTAAVTLQYSACGTHLMRLPYTGLFIDRQTSESCWASALSSFDLTTVGPISRTFPLMFLLLLTLGISSGPSLSSPLVCFWVEVVAADQQSNHCSCAARHKYAFVHHALHWGLHQSGS